MIHYLYLFLYLSFYVSDGLGQRIGNPDDTEKIERPCPTYDVNCVREFFAKHGNCKKTYGPAPDPLIRAQGQFYIPSSNLSITVLDFAVVGLNGRIEEFYVNRDTDNLVLAIEFRNFGQSSPNNAYFQFNRRGKEPVITRGFGTLMYQSVTITAIIPNTDSLQLERAECTSFVSDTMFPASIVTDADANGNGTDPQVAQASAGFLANYPQNIQELYLSDAAFYIAAYIQYNLCDFGLLLT